MILWLLVACQAPPPVTLAPGVRTWLDEGDVVVQIVATDPLDAVPPPRSELEFTPDGDLRRERAGDHVVLTQRFHYSGDDGHYVLVGPEVDVDGTPARAADLFVDIGVDAPREGELVDIAEPDPVRDLSLVWKLLAAAVALLGVASVGLWRLYRSWRDTPAPPPEPVPPDVAALRAWADVRASEASDHDKALAISTIFRVYAEAVLGFPATSDTTPEVLAHLDAIARVDKANLPRAKRLLRATDRIKFAEAATTGALFDELDSDLRGFVESTRPRRLGGDP